MKFDLDKFKDLTSDNKKLSVDFKPLNFDALLKSGAVRVTNIGLENGQFNPDPKAGFSLVSKYNDLVGNNTQKWIDNPSAYDVVKNIFLNSPENVGAHKYLQIVESAKQLGLPEDVIFVKKPETEIVNLFENPFPSSIED